MEPVRRFATERVLAIRQWTSTLLTFRTSRPFAFEFKPGHYTRLGLGEGEDTIWRPFSMASATDDGFLEFIAVLVPGGAFSQRLSRIAPGDTIAIDTAAYGFLTLDQLAPGTDLWLMASGTGLGPFMSILRGCEAWLAFERLILVHSVRHAVELVWRDEIAALPDAHPVGARLTYLPVVTREPGVTPLFERIPHLLAAGSLEAAAAPLAVASSRVMVCGNPDLARNLRADLGSRGFVTSRRGVPGQMAFEKYW